MVKSTFSMVVVCLLLVTLSILETNFINKNFNDFKQKTLVVYQKVESHVATVDDVYGLQKNWLAKKKCLHAVIPHTEIKEVDLWLSETVKLVQNEQWTDAVSKLEVLIELTEQIPQTFSIKVENIL